MNATPPRMQNGKPTSKRLIGRRDHPPARSKLWSAVSVMLSLWSGSTIGATVDKSVLEKLRETHRVSVQVSGEFAIQEIFVFLLIVLVVFAVISVPVILIWRFVDRISRRQAKVKAFDPNGHSN